MTDVLELAARSPKKALPEEAVVRRRIQRRVRGFWSGVAAVGIFSLLIARDLTMVDIVSASLVAGAALLPVYWSISDKVPGFPVLPAFTITFLWSYASPLFINAPELAPYSDSDRMLGAAQVALFLLLASVIWRLIATRGSSRQRKEEVFSLSKRAVGIFQVGLGVGILFTTTSLMSWLPIPGGLFSVAQRLAFAVATVSTFVLCFWWGRRSLTQKQTVVIAALLLVFLTMNAATLLLISAMSIVAVGFAGFTLGRRKVNWVFIAVAGIVFAFLHAGKGEMRERYWRGGEELHATDLPRFFLEWTDAAIENLPVVFSGGNGQQSIFQRAGLMHLYLRVLKESPIPIPYMRGDTYSIIPQLFIPRVLNEEKIASHEGTYRLNIHYGIQSRENTADTTIAWGMLNEAAANFGFPGVLGLGLFFGVFYGLVARMTRGSATLSFRFLFALVVFSVAIQNEYTAGVFVATLFQSTVALVMLRALIITSGGATLHSIGPVHSSTARQK